MRWTHYIILAGDLGEVDALHPLGVNQKVREIGVWVSNGVLAERVGIEPTRP